MEIPDLTKCNFMGDKRKPAVAVGFIGDDDTTYNKGEVSGLFLKYLEKYCKNGVHLRRSRHACAICGKSHEEYSKLYDYNNIDVSAGNADILVPSSSGVFYVAPIQIFHYIKDHHYLPPKEFIDAVLENNNIDITDYATSRAPLEPES